MTNKFRGFCADYKKWIEVQNIKQGKSKIDVIKTYEDFLET